MFKRLDDNAENLITVTIDGQPVEVAAGETVAAAVLASGIDYTCREHVREGMTIERQHSTGALPK